MLKKDYRNFISNYWVVSYFWCFGILMVVVCVTFVMTNLPLWSISIIACIALCLIFISIAMIVFSRCRIDNKGIKIMSMFKHKTFLYWNDIYSIKVVCSKAYMRYHLAYIIEFNNSIKIKTNSEVALAIKEYSKDCENFYNLYIDSLDSAEQTY